MVNVLLPFIPVIVLLAMVTVVSRLGMRPPGFVYVAFAVVGIALNVYLFGVLAAAISLGAGLLLFVLLVGVAASRVSGVAIFSLSASVVALPWWYWWSLALGLGVALVVSLAHIRKAGGEGRVSFLTLETMQAFGVSPVGTVMKPDLERIPMAEKSDEPELDAEDESPRLRVPEFLLAGAVIGATVSSVLFLV